MIFTKRNINNITTYVSSAATTDESIMREIINRKLAKSRKDLEDISEATDIPVVKVTRQSGTPQSLVYSQLVRLFPANYSTTLLLSLPKCRQHKKDVHLPGGRQTV